VKTGVLTGWRRPNGNFGKRRGPSQVFWPDRPSRDFPVDQSPLFFEISEIVGINDSMIEAVELVAEICSESRSAFICEPDSDQISDFL
jgi:hypothetical protein